MARNNNMGRNEVIVANCAVMADVIAAPQHYIVTYSHIGLDYIVLKDKAMATQFSGGGHLGVWRNERGKAIAHRYDSPDKSRTQAVQIAVYQGDVNIMLRG